MYLFSEGAGTEGWENMGVIVEQQCQEQIDDMQVSNSRCLEFNSRCLRLDHRGCFFAECEFWDEFDLFYAILLS